MAKIDAAVREALHLDDESRELDAAYLADSAQALADLTDELTKAFDEVREAFTEVGEAIAAAAEDFRWLSDALKREDEHDPG